MGLGRHYCWTRMGLFGDVRWKRHGRPLCSAACIRIERCAVASCERRVRLRETVALSARERAYTKSQI